MSPRRTIRPRSDRPRSDRPSDRDRSDRTFRAGGPGDVLALVPVVLGFVPEDSVVVLTIGGVDSGVRQPVHARVDLPRDPVAVEEVAAQLASVVGRSGVDRVAVVSYCADAGLAEAVTRSLDAAMTAVGTRVVCAVRADAGRWWDVGADDLDAPGTPYDPAVHPFTARAVVDGRVVHGSRAALAASLVGDDPADAAAVAEAAEIEVDRLLPLVVAAAAARARAGEPAGDGAVDEPFLAEGRWVRRRIRRFAADGLRLGPGEAARLAVATAVDIPVRDVAWAELRPETARVQVDLWRDVARRVPADAQFAAATLLGFAAWVDGQGALAWCAVELALASREDYSLATLLADMLAAGTPPSFWSPLRPEDLMLFTHRARA